VVRENGRKFLHITGDCEGGSIKVRLRSPTRDQPSQAPVTQIKPEGRDSLRPEKVSSGELKAGNFNARERRRLSSNEKKHRSVSSDGSPKVPPLITPQRSSAAEIPTLPIPREIGVRKKTEFHLDVPPIKTMKGSTLDNMVLCTKLKPKCKCVCDKQMDLGRWCDKHCKQVYNPSAINFPFCNFFKLTHGLLLFISHIIIIPYECECICRNCPAESILTTFPRVHLTARMSLSI